MFEAKYIKNIFLEEEAIWTWTCISCRCIQKGGLESVAFVLFRSFTWSALYAPLE